jgi:PAS domain S-box-containing protein
LCPLSEELIIGILKSVGRCGGNGVVSAVFKGYMAPTPAIRRGRRLNHHHRAAPIEEQFISEGWEAEQKGRSPQLRVNAGFDTVCASPDGGAAAMRKILTERLARIYIDVPAVRPGTVGAHVLALVFVGLAAAVGVTLDPYVQGVPYITFLPAILIVTLVSGFGAGLLAVVLSTVATGYFLPSPHLSFYVDRSADTADLLLFASLSSLCVIVIFEMRSAIDRRQTERALYEGKDRLQLALDAALLGWWEYDPRRGVVAWDARSQEILDIAQDEGPFEEFFKRVHPDDREGYVAARKAALDPVDPKPFAYMFRIVRRDGKVRWVESHGLVYFQGTGPERHLVSFVGAIQDVTEHKRQEEEEHLLMREVNHRAKNMLSVVAAVARQTTARNPEDFVERFSERLQALSAHQDLLIQNEWHGVDVEDLVRAQLSHFGSLLGSRIAVHGPKARLTPASAQAIGLAIHELATNAGKYGALSTDTGRVNVRWEIDGQTFTMSWAEQGGPPVFAPNRLGFGTVVMEAMAERSVDGNVSLDYARSGLIWRLACPAKNALGPGGLATS